MPTTSQQNTPNLDLPYLMPGQALKYITHNEALRALDIRVNTRIASRSTQTPPSAPPNGMSYIVPENSEEWGVAAGQLVSYLDGGLTAYAPRAGWLVWVEDEAAYVQYDGTAWRALQTARIETLPQLGINGAADATNRLAVASDAALFTHAGSDHRLVVNKASAIDTAAFIFQTDYAGHAEFGLVGDNDFSLKTSADGQTFNEAFRVLAATANLRLPDGRQLEFDIDDGNGPGVSVIRIHQGNLTFEKPTSDIDLAEGTAFVFAQCGGRNDGNPFWQGLQLTGTSVTQDGANVVPRAGLYWRYSDTADPDDLSFVFKATASSLDVDMTFIPSGDGHLIAETRTGMRIGPETKPVQAMLDVQGAVRVRTYQSATLPPDQGAGAIVMVSDAPGGLALAFFDGTDWRTAHDREVV